MTPNYRRDISALSRDDLMEDYSERALRGNDSVVRYALRNRSVSMRNILVRMATDLMVSSEELKEFVLSNRPLDNHVMDADALGNLGRLAILQNTLDDDTSYGVKLLDIAQKITSSGQLSLKNKLILVQHHILSGNNAEASALLEQYPELKEVSFGYLAAELDNPFTQGSAGNKQRWLDAFNKVFRDSGLAPVGLAESREAPFDRLTCSVRDGDNGLGSGPLVSVVVTVYEPNKTRLTTSIRSLLNQTWKNLEVIIVDDASGASFQHVFDDIGAMDDRIRIIHASQNQGTYVARNIGYSAANGDFITGQDDDDWSHPERIARQVRVMEENPNAIGCRVRAVRCENSLNRVYLSVLPVGQNASSLFIRRKAFELAGGYLRVRKAGDTEFHKRIEAITGQPVVEIQKPLSIIRILAGSLSRGDFGPGWMHDSRHSFRSSYTRWHETSSADDLKIVDTQELPVKIPRRLAVDNTSESRRELDVVFAGDWQSFGGPQKSMLQEIRALQNQNLRIGVLDLEAARFMYRRQRLPLTKHIQDLINSGAVDEVFYDDDVHIRLFIHRYPPILQFFKHEISTLSIDRMLIVANQAPAELDGTDIRYLVGDVDDSARRSFRISPTWVPQGPQIRDVLNYYLEAPKLAGYDMPGILEPDEWWLDRLWYRSTIPVVGRHSRDNEMKWPADKSVLEKVYRTDGRHDIRIMGGANTALEVLGQPAYPSPWTVYKTDELSVRNFLYSLDFFIYYQHENAIEAFGRAILEAIAAGLVVILPPHFEPVFKEAALYASPDEVASLVTKYHSDFSLYEAQLCRSRQVLVQRFSHRAYRERINEILLESGAGDSL